MGPLNAGVDPSSSRIAAAAACGDESCTRACVSGLPCCVRSLSRSISPNLLKDSRIWLSVMVRGSDVTYKLLLSAPWSLPANFTRIGGRGTCRGRPCKAVTAIVASSTRDICTRAAHVGYSGSGLSSKRRRTTLPHFWNSDCSKNSGNPTGQPLTYRLLFGVGAGRLAFAFSSAKRTTMGAPNSVATLPSIAEMAVVASSGVANCTSPATSGTLLEPAPARKGSGRMRHHITVPYLPKMLRSWSSEVVQWMPLT
mmetsp:Transcript_97543/g.252426  ORF Transcript_97543/g.252426 Transcript_97543/m.252426 type:complete len:254 (+) Transcript_97543:244-1005(+)